MFNVRFLNSLNSPLSSISVGSRARPSTLALSAVLISALIMSVVSLGAHTAHAAPAPSKTIKMLLNSIRYDKDEFALKQFNSAAQGALIFGEVWTNTSPQERSRFTNALHGFFTKMAFPKLRAKYFKHIETIIYGEPQTLKGGAVKLRATIVILHALKKEEIPADFTLRERDGRWLIEDFWINPKEGSASFITNLREKQITPLFQKKGWDGLIIAMEKRVADLK